MYKNYPDNYIFPAIIEKIKKTTIYIFPIYRAVLPRVRIFRKLLIRLRVPWNCIFGEWSRMMR